ncbi:TRAP transporter solute receptor, TAXI family [Sphaerochaeta pleomorpha str. Grapes]|uniref:TRAP transporter solute receptor, TAXI family n=1 Tax=Sphaerochaeta pleomorpha (strain ATCC BAA-1885 / DSM 22778 / Grapes) TaxID=158190 RepID=G8QWZ7_SPHPG|nr:TAXI family TRAP transporter solute-binding subunit [Sphaerochaeta pleomorpha]AEV29501.1 TRAP transporter solute receptor, TAXI family [Sphaerochaeta pleomorpha str. Grapes]
MKKAFCVLGILVFVLFLAPCQGQKDGSTTGSASSSPKRYSIGTSSNGGNFYLIGGGIATILNNALPQKYVFTSEETGGSAANLAMIENGDAEIGFAMTSALSAGLDGTAKWTNGKPMTKVRGLVPLYPSYMTMYALASSGIHSISDFTGKIIGLGSKGAAMDGVLREAFGKMGIEPSSIFNDGHGATASAVSQGQVDVAVLFSYPPFAAITELEATKTLRFIGLTVDEQKFLSEAFPFYTASTMPKGSYSGAIADVPTVSEWNMLVCSSDLSDDDAYLIAKTIYEHNPDLLAVHKSLKYCTSDNSLNFNIPLHPGVVKYLKEQGIDVPARLNP